MKYRVKSTNYPPEDANAYCRNCDFESSSIFEADRIGGRRAAEKVAKQARYHAEKEGHIVDVYRETRSIIKPIT